MKILVTGNKGFIGSHLQKKLEELGHNIVGMDIKVSRGEDIRADLCVKSIFKKHKFDAVIHLAALAGVRKSLEIPQDYFETNITGTYYLLREAERYGIKKFISASSSSVYGTHRSPLIEGMECNHQLSPYAVSKKAGEMLCKLFDRVPTIVVRPFTAYGPNGRDDMVIKRIIEAGINETEFEKYGDGTSVRGYTNVFDFVDGIVKLLGYKMKDNFEIFNLGGTEIVSLNEFIEIVKEVFPELKVVQVKRNKADAKYSYADISKAKKVLSWEPKRNFKKELKKLCYSIKTKK